MIQIRQTSPFPPSRDKPDVHWEDTCCLLCGGNDLSPPIVESADTSPGGTGLWFAVVRCGDCGLCFTNPRPTIDSISRFYPANYSPHLRTGKRRPSFMNRLTARLMSDYRKYLPMHGRGRLLDFGCGGGSYLRRMRDQGWGVTGVDASASTVRRIQLEFGLDVQVGSLPHAEFEPASFDIITMWQSLEHVHNPLGVLRAAYDLLAPGGRLIIEVPNIDSLAFRWFGQMWFGLDLPRHLTHFAPSTLEGMLLRASFDVRSIRTRRHSSWTRASARQTRLHPKAKMWQRWLRNRTVSHFAGVGAWLSGKADCILALAEKPA